jgi:transglutaminase-like putative cysteine protease
MIKKATIALLSLLFLTSSLFFALKTLASEQFAVDSVVTYKVGDAGATVVTHDIILENLFSSLYATTYTLNLDNISAENIDARDGNGRVIPLEVKEENQTLSIKLTFSDSVVGVGEKRHFKISYTNSNFAVKTGEVWEISIPRLGNNESFRNYHIILEIPDAFGQEAYVSPQPTERKDENGLKNYTFSKELISETGVTAGFGQFQVFTFNLSYHLENPLAVNSQTEIALPPDTAFQKVYFTRLDPKPADVKVDGDGNYIAVYKLFPRQRIDINAEGAVQIFAGFRPFPHPSDEELVKNLLPTSYWQSDDPNIKLLAQNLKTPQEIYNYVASKLKYDLNRVQPNVARLGAVNALLSPSQAICMEFTDLFVAISRAAGIPAREINGFAYTENKELQPLSLVADVLHAWPEYYDKEKRVWIPIDPTWGSTSGVDFFSKLDLRHFTFVIHGASDKEPYPPGSYKLGPNPQKDVFVSFGRLPSASNSIPQVKITQLRSIPFLDTLYSYSIYNPGPATLYSFYPAVYFDSKLYSRSLVQILPPFATTTGEIKVPYSILAKDMPDNIKLVVNETSITKPTNKSQVVINSLVVLFAVFIFIVILVLFKLKKLNFDKITVTITRIYAKITGNSGKGTGNSGNL